MRRFYALEQQGKRAILNIFEDIMCDSGLPGKINELTDIEEIEVHISSYGGDVSEGLAIYNSLKNHKAKVITVNDGFACSIASVVFCAGDERKMNEASLFMIHNAWSFACGNAGDMRKAADDLDKITEASERIYEKTSNLSLEKIKEYMDKETWFSPDECLEYGFATEIIKDESNEKSSQSVKRHILEILKSKQEENDMDPIRVGDFTVEEKDGGILIKKADSQSDTGTADQEKLEAAVNAFMKSFLGGNK